MAYLPPTCVRCAEPIKGCYGAIQKYCGPCRVNYVYPIRAKVGAIVARAKRDGVLKPASSYKCADCDKQAQVYDHRSYEAPLDVVAVCRSCNWKRGPVTFFLPKAFKTRHLLTNVSDAPDCVCIALMPLGSRPDVLEGA